MNKKINIDILTLKTLFSDYKPFLAPLFTIFSCFLIFLIFILPQANEFLSSQKTVNEEKEKLNNLRRNLTTLQNLSDGELDSQYELLSYALPPEKNFEAIINALSYSANVSGVILGDFDFTVGTITDIPSDIQKFPFLEIELNLAGGVETVETFLDTLSKTLPLSRVSKLSLSESGTTVKLAFFYKPYPQTRFSENTTINPVSSDGKTLIKELEMYNNPSDTPLPVFIQESATESAL